MNSFFKRIIKTISKTEYIWFFLILLFSLAFTNKYPDKFYLLLLIPLLFLFLIINKFYLKYGDLIGFFIFSFLVFPPIKIGGLSIQITYLFIIVFFPLISAVQNYKSEDINRLKFLFSVVLLYAFSILLSITFSSILLQIGIEVNYFYEIIKVLIWLSILLLLRKLNLSYIDFKKILIYFKIGILVTCGIVFIEYYNIGGLSDSITFMYSPKRLTSIEVNMVARVVGTFENPNQMSLILSLGTCIFLIDFLLSKNKFSFINLLLMSIVIVANTKTSSRTGVATTIFGFLLILIYYFSLKNIKINLTKVFILSLGFFIGIIYFFLFVDIGFLMRISSALDLSLDASFNARLQLWKKNFDYFLQSPLFGWGPSEGVILSYADNEYLSMLRKYGFIGFSFYIMILYYPFLKTFNLLKNLKTDNEIRIVFISNVFSFIVLLAAATMAIFFNIRIVVLLFFFYGVTWNKYFDKYELKK